MLQVQEFLKQNTIDDLTAQLGIKASKHETLPLVILNYDQIESPKTHPVVRECRGLVLHADTHQVVAKSFPRFFNWGEVADEMELFDFSDFSVHSKEDGSLVLLYHFENEWRVNTRGSFAGDPIQHQNFTWAEAIVKALGVVSLKDLNGKLNEDYTYVGEFCSPWNKVVRKYDKPTFYLLTIMDRRSLAEVGIAQCDAIAKEMGWLRPIQYTFSSIDQIQEWLREQSATDATFEGVVIRDSKNARWKIKSATYLGLHRLKGDDVWNPKHLLPFILAGEEDELLTYFPEVRDRFFELKSQILDEYCKLVEAWGDHRHIEDQKEFALTIKGQRFSSLLFQVRKEHGKAQSSKDLRKKWAESEALILKHIVKGTPA